MVGKMHQNKKKIQYRKLNAFYFALTYAVCFHGYTNQLAFVHFG